MENIGYQALILSILGVDGEFPTPEQAFAYLINQMKKYWKNSPVNRW